MRNSSDIFPLFASLCASESGSSDSVNLHTIPLGPSKTHRLAKFSPGHPVLLIETSHPLSVYPAPLKLENLTVKHGYEGRFAHCKNGEIKIFTIVEYHVIEADLVKAFLSLSFYLSASLPPKPDPRDVAFELQKIIHIFQSLKQPPTKTIQGLWAELFVLAESPCISRWAAAWHDDPLDRYDFAFKRLRVEVKSSGKRIRRHSFSHEQLHPPVSIKLWVASLFVERLNGGSDCTELLRRIQAGLSADLAFKLESKVMCVLGSDFEKACLFQYDEALAAQSLVFIPIEAIPRLSADLPNGISCLKYTVDVPVTGPLNQQHPVDR